MRKIVIAGLASLMAVMAFATVAGAQEESLLQAIADCGFTTDIRAESGIQHVVMLDWDCVVHHVDPPAPRVVGDDCGHGWLRVGDEFRHAEYGVKNTIEEVAEVDAFGASCLTQS